MINGNCPGEDNITNEMLKAIGDYMLESVRIFQNKCIDEENIPEKWNKADVILLFK